MLLANQNDQLKNKINNLIEERKLEKYKDLIPKLLLENPEFNDFNEE